MYCRLDKIRIRNILEKSAIFVSYLLLLIYCEKLFIPKKKVINFVCDFW